MAEPQSAALTPWLRSPHVGVDYNKVLLKSIPTIDKFLKNPILRGGRSPDRLQLDRMEPRSPSTLIPLAPAVKAVVIPGAIVLAIGAGLAVTNPPPDRYASAAADYISNQLQTRTCQDAPGFLQAACQATAGQLRPTIAQVVLRNTDRQDFYLFSIYRTKLDLRELVPPPLGNKLPSYEAESLGIGTQIITYRTETRDR